MTAGIGPADSQALQRALTAQPEVVGTLYQEEDQFKGYRWYDGLRRATAVRFTCQRKPGGKYSLVEADDDRDPAGDPQNGSRMVTRVQSIRIEINLKHADGKATTRVVETDLALRPQHVKRQAPQQEIRILVTHETRIDKHALDKLLKLAYFKKDYDNAGTTEGNKRERAFEKSIEATTTEMLDDAKKASRRNQLSTLAAPLLEKLENGQTLTLQRNGTGRWTVTVETPTQDENVMHVQKDAYSKSDETADGPAELKRLGMRRCRTCSTRTTG